MTKLVTSIVTVVFCLCWLNLTTVSVSAQGFLLVDNPDHRFHLPRPSIRPRPLPPMSYKIKELSVNSRIQGQIAQTQVTQSFVNTGSRQMEVSFVFPLPYDGAVDRLTLMVDGKEFDAKLLPAKEARSIYEGYIRRNQDPALLEWMGTGMFKTSVFPVPPGAERKVTLRYSQLLRKDQNLTDFLFPLTTAKYTSTPVENINFRIAIDSKVKIKNVYSPTHPISINRSGGKNVLVEYEAKDQVPTSDFRLFFDTTDEVVGASLVSYWPQGEEDGYFVLLASPEIRAKDADRPKKTVVFVIDRSGSMTGKKMEQAKEALKFVVNNLRKGDTFNIVAYDSDVESFRPELQRFNEQTRQEAVGFIEGIFAGGSTNIESALTTAFSMIKDKTRPNYVTFLTDGQPTAGETNESKIVEIAKAQNKLGARLISMGVGYDVNSRLIDRLSRANRGQSEYVTPDEDLEVHVSRLYKKMSSPVLTDAQVKFDFDVKYQTARALVNRLYPSESFDLFEGEQMVIVGRYGAAGTAKIKLSGMLGGEKQKFNYNVKFAKQSGNASNGFVEKLWAMRRIGQIIDDLDLQGQNQELINELVALSTKHGILTPYTSFLADDLAKASELADVTTLQRRAGGRLGQLEVAEGEFAFRQRSYKNQLLKGLQPQDANESASKVIASNRPQAGAGGRGAGQSPASSTATRPRFGRGGLGGGGSDLSVVLPTVKEGDKGLSVVKEQVLYTRGKRLIAVSARDVDTEKQKDDIIKLKRFGKDYFDLVKANTEAENLVFAQQKDDQELLIRLRGKIYLIE